MNDSALCLLARAESVEIVPYSPGFAVLVVGVVPHPYGGFIAGEAFVLDDFDNQPLVYECPYSCAESIKHSIPSGVRIIFPDIF